MPFSLKYLFPNVMNLYEIVLIYEGCKTVFDVSNKLYCGYLLLNLK